MSTILPAFAAGGAGGAGAAAFLGAGTSWRMRLTRERMARAYMMVVRVVVLVGAYADKLEL